MNVQIRLPQAALSHFAHRAIDKHFRKAMKQEEEVLADRDPEALHQMRVGLRRLRTAIQVFGFATDVPSVVSESRIRKFAQVLGAVRDLDVLKLELTSHTDLPDAEQKALKQTLKKLDHQRSRDFHQLEKTLNSRKYKEFKQGMEDWLALPQLNAIAQLPIQDVLPDILLPLISGILLHPAWLMGVEFALEEKLFLPITPESIRSLLDQGDLIHDLRKQMKRLRYQTELFTDFYGEDYKAQVREFQQIQEVLGQIQDSVVLQEFLHKYLDDSIEKLCPIFSNKLDQRRTIAFKEWRSLQEKYLDTKFRNQLRQLVLRH
ncbi:CHAD domain-containing protein [Leptolyngbya sp. NIES-2104]|uniref:CHAD domain-containing protein n=1 Tax=Leptolyngbya sp. NIES-2104 TaxID=1552121 RepID=UPI0006EC9EC4|nr:CHAD domain-containing protein [Leptolyngbya sp. NIES-2104]GAP96174.1 adenylate cyclase [Leptolyngbya sp. NIES-2104]